MSQIAKEIMPIDLTQMPRQSFSESFLKEHGAVFYAEEDEAPYNAPEVYLWEQYLKAQKLAKIDETLLSDDERRIAQTLHQVDLKRFKSPWNVHYASHEPERKFSDLVFVNAELFDSFVKMPNQGGYSFPYSYKPAKSGKTHTANETFSPDFFIRVRSTKDILVVEIKTEGDDSNRNRAKCRDGLAHFDTLNTKLAEMKEPWCYYFYFLSPDDYTSFFRQVQEGTFKDWKSGLMQALI